MKIVQLCFPKGKKKAFTLSYDDGVIQDKRLVSLMNQYELRGTFHLNSNFIGIKEQAVIDHFMTDVSKIELEELGSVYAGHEIAAHGLEHLKLTDISSQTVVYQIMEDRKNLEQITGELISGFSYPFGCFNQKVVEILQNCGMEYARTVNRTGQFKLPEDFYRWNPTCHHNDADLFELLEKFAKDENGFGEPMLFYLWGHSYEFDQRNNWEHIKKAFSFINSYKDSIWMATNGEICHYVKQFQKLVFSADGKMLYNPTADVLWLSIDQKTYEIGSGEKISIS